MNAVSRAQEILKSIETAVLFILLLSLVLLAFGGVLLRDLFGVGMVGADILMRHMVLWIGFLGAAVAAAEGKHFAFEALHIPEGTLRKSLDAASSIAACAACGFLAYAAWEFLQDERASGGMLVGFGNLRIPRWIFAAAIPVGFSLVGLHTLLRAVEEALDLGGRQSHVASSGDSKS